MGRTTVALSFNSKDLYLQKNGAAFFLGTERVPSIAEVLLK
jgi:hypothetical protein